MHVVYFMCTLCVLYPYLKYILHVMIQVDVRSSRFNLQVDNLPFYIYTYSYEYTEYSLFTYGYNN